MKNYIVLGSFAGFVLAYTVSGSVQIAFVCTSLSCIGLLWWYFPKAGNSMDVTMESRP